MTADSPGFRPALVGCISEGAAGNPTVAMMEAAFAHHGVRCRYINCEVSPSDLAEAVRGMRALGFHGYNVSMPHKVRIVGLLDGLGESARLIGAVNCVVRRDRKWIGENTDGKGFVSALRTVLDPLGKAVLLLGAGGAARAIAVELALSGVARIRVANRTKARGQELVELLHGRTKVEASALAWADRLEVPCDTDVVVNATSVGLYDGIAEIPIRLDSLRPSMVIADVVFSPPETHFLREARQRGCVTLDGLGMLVAQGAIGLKYWTGVDADVGVMRRALEAALGLERGAFD